MEEEQSNHNHDGGLEISPLLVGLLGVMAAALIVAIFHFLIVCWCNDAERGRRSTTSTPSTTPSPSPAGRRPTVRGNYREEASISSRSFSTARLLIASSYSRDWREEVCAVCLGEFNESDEVRVLPECTHVFHVLCIDQWLNSHTSCPICRIDASFSSQDPVPVPPDLGGAPEPQPDSGGATSPQIVAVQLS